MDCPFPKLDKYLTKLCDKVVVSKSTVSRYYYINDNVLRVSDHVSFNILAANYSIIIDPNNHENFVVFNPLSLMCTSMNYDELKAFVKSWCIARRITNVNEAFMSQFTPGQIKAITSFIEDNRNNIKKYSKINLLAQDNIEQNG